MIQFDNNICFFDIETVPHPGAKKPVFDESTVKCGNLKDPDKIQAKIDEAKAEFDNSIVKKMSLDGALGMVVAISARLHKEDVSNAKQFNEVNDGEDDTQLIKNFMDFAENATLCGWNIKGFDIPFLWKRSILTGSKQISTRRYLNLCKKYGNGCLDLMDIWGNYSMVSMLSCADALGIKSKTEMTGADVYDAWLKKDFESISKYCAEDVATVKAIYDKLY